MREEIQIHDMIDRYLRGELTGEELLNFEETLKADIGLKRKIDAQRDFLIKFKNYERREHLKNKLNEFHSELNIENYNSKRNTRKFFTLHFPTIAVAASVALLTVFGALFTSNYLHSLKKDERAYFKSLNRDIQKIKKSQNTILHELNNSEGSVKLPNKAFGGTGFALTQDGIIITSAHVVAQADSIILENQQYSYKAKLLYQDTKYDIAILKIEDSSFTLFSRIPYLIKKKEADLGAKVYTLGFPRDEVVYGEGYISAGSGYEADTLAYQVSIPVNPGNSGGPLMDEQGNLVGMISGKHSESEGAAFALKSAYILEMIGTALNDSLPRFILPKHNQLKGLNKTTQLKKTSPFVFDVKVYN